VVVVFVVGILESNVQDLGRPLNIPVAVQSQNALRGPQAAARACVRRGSWQSSVVAVLVADRA
jgi:hypothetical protein